MRIRYLYLPNGKQRNSNFYITALAFTYVLPTSERMKYDKFKVLYGNKHEIKMSIYITSPNYINI